MKIAFCGSHGVGKTTAMLQLASSLKKKNLDVAIVKEAARRCPFPLNQKATFESQLWIFAETLVSELEALKEVQNKGIVLCDRTLLDVLSYFRRVSPIDSKNLYPFVRRYMTTYDLVFYMEPKKGYLKKDGVRSTDKRFQKKIDDIINRYKLDIGIPFFMTKNNKERVKFVELFLEGKL